jgi:hypothetical protein
MAAPSAAPDLRVREILHSRIELTWEEIPLCQRNGIVQSYQIFYWDEQGNTKGGKILIVTLLMIHR